MDLNLKKDDKIKSLISDLQRSLESYKLNIIDYWDADLCSIGIMIEETPTILIYFSVYGKKNKQYDVQIEYHESIDLSSPSNMITDRYKNLNYQGIVDKLLLLIKTKQTLLMSFKYALQALSQDSKTQISLYPDFVVKADELALEFDDSLKPLIDNRTIKLTSEQLGAIQIINKELSLMSEDKSLWTEQSLKDRKEWQIIRDLAKNAIKLFNWENCPPPKNRNKYVQGKKS
jgi:hypothetical protein